MAVPDRAGAAGSRLPRLRVRWFSLGADAVRDRVEACVLVQLLLVLGRCRLQVEDDLLHRAGERIWRLS